MDDEETTTEAPPPPRASWASWAKQKASPAYAVATLQHQRQQIIDLGGDPGELLTEAEYDAAIERAANHSVTQE